MKKETQQITDIRPQVVFDLQNTQPRGAALDPTTSLGATTFTGWPTKLTAFQRAPFPGNK